MDNDKTIATPAVRNKRRYNKAFEQDVQQLTNLTAEIARLNNIKEAYLMGKRQNTTNSQIVPQQVPIEPVLHHHSLTPNTVMPQPVYTPPQPPRTIGLPPLHPPVRPAPIEQAMAPSAFSPAQMHALRNRYSDSTFLTIPLLLTLDYTHDEIFDILQLRGGIQFLNLMAKKDHKDLNFLTMAKYARSVKHFHDGLDYYTQFCQTPAYDATRLINILEAKVAYNAVTTRQESIILKPSPVHTAKASLHTVNPAALMNNVITSQPSYPLHDDPNLHYVFLPVPETTPPLYPPCYDHLAAVGSTTAYSFHTPEAHRQHFALQQAVNHADQYVNEP